MGLFRYRIVVMSNQGGIRLQPDVKTVKSDVRRLTIFKDKIGYILNQLNISMNLYAATENDRFRKPRAGMWEEMLVDYHLDLVSSIDLQDSFFVGDAGGRKAVKGVPQDHACSDR